MAATVAGPGSVGIGRDAEGLAEVNGRGGGFDGVVLRGHGSGQGCLGLRRQHDRRLGGLDHRHVDLGFHLDRLGLGLGLQLGHGDFGRLKLDLSLGGSGRQNLGRRGQLHLLWRRRSGGEINTVSSYLCSSSTFFAVAPI